MEAKRNEQEVAKSILKHAKGEVPEVTPIENQEIVIVPTPTPVVAEPVKAAVPTPHVSVRVISAAELPMDISFDFNARSPSVSSRAYQSMRDTLRESPDKFLDLNGGVSIASDKYVMDGGHTVMAILHAIKEDSVDPNRIHLLLRDYGKLSAAEMGRLSAALNRRVTPPIMGEKDLEGAWEPIKFALSAKYKPLYEFRPNTKPDAPFSVTFLVGLLYAWTETRAERAYSGKGKLVRHFTAEKYARVMPRLNQAIGLWSKTYKMLLEEKRVMSLDCCKKDAEVTLPNGEKVTGFIPEALVWPIFASLSVLLNDAGEWTADPDVELERRRGKLVKQLLADFKAVGSNPGAYGKAQTSYLNAIVALRSA